VASVRRTALAVALSFAVLAASFSTASARDTKMSKLYRIDAKIVAALEKKKLGTTKLVREHFADKSLAKIKRWGKTQKLDQNAFLLAVYQAQIIGVKEIGAKHAWLIVTQCNVAGLAQLKGSEKNWLTRCVNEKSTEHGVLKNPVELVKTEAWLAGAKVLASGNTTERVGWARSVKIEQIYKTDSDVLRALHKAKYKTTVAVWEALSLAAKRTKFAKRYRLDVESVNRYVAAADLMRLAKVSPKLAHVMYLAGYKSVVNLKGLAGALLEKKLSEANKRHLIMGKTPDAKTCQELIDAARPMKQHP